METTSYRVQRIKCCDTCKFEGLAFKGGVECELAGLCGTRRQPVEPLGLCDSYKPYNEARSCPA